MTKKQQVDNCRVCGIHRSKTSKFRTDICNACYAKEQREKKKNGIESTGKRGRPKVYNKGEKSITTWVSKRAATLFVGMAEKTGKPKIDLLTEMIENKAADIAEAEGVSVDELLEIGLNSSNS